MIDLFYAPWISLIKAKMLTEQKCLITWSMILSNYRPSHAIVLLLCLTSI